jgi:hypothetical protein
MYSEILYAGISPAMHVGIGFKPVIAEDKTRQDKGHVVYLYWTQIGA